MNSHHTYHYLMSNTPAVKSWKFNIFKTSSWSLREQSKRILQSSSMLLRRERQRTRECTSHSSDWKVAFRESAEVPSSILHVSIHCTQFYDSLLIPLECCPRKEINQLECSKEPIIDTEKTKPNIDGFGPEWSVFSLCSLWLAPLKLLQAWTCLLQRLTDMINLQL